MLVEEAITLYFAWYVLYRLPKRQDNYMENPFLYFENSMGELLSKKE